MANALDVDARAKVRRHQNDDRSVFDAVDGLHLLKIRVLVKEKECHVRHVVHDHLCKRFNSPGHKDQGSLRALRFPTVQHIHGPFPVVGVGEDSRLPLLADMEIYILRSYCRALDVKLFQSPHVLIQRLALLRFWQEQSPDLEPSRC